MKDISSTLASFKADNVRPSFSVLDDHEPFRREEPTRDPDVWPPPTPVEHRYNLPGEYIVTVSDCRLGSNCDQPVSSQVSMVSQEILSESALNKMVIISTCHCFERDFYQILVSNNFCNCHHEDCHEPVINEYSK